MRTETVKNTHALRQLLKTKFPDSAARMSLNETTLSTGIRSLDSIFAEGGIPFGQLLEITGGVSSGKTSIALKFLAALCQYGQAAYINFSNGFFPSAAIKVVVDIDKLWIVHPRSLPKGFRIIELLLSHELIHGAVIDLVSFQSQFSPPSTLLHRLRQTCAKSKAMLLFLTNDKQRRNFLTPSSVSLRLGVRRTEGSKFENEVIKSRLCREALKLEVTL